MVGSRQGILHHRQNLEAFTATELDIVICWHILFLPLLALLVAQVIANSGNAKKHVLGSDVPSAVQPTGEGDILIM